MTHSLFAEPSGHYPEIRVRVAETLGHSGMLAVGQIPALGRALSDPAPKVREEAAIALWRFGPLATNATEALLQALHDPSPRVRSYAALALGVARPPIRAMPALIGMLPSSHTCRNAARALGALGPDGRDAQPYLIARLQNSYAGLPSSSGALDADDEQKREMQSRLGLMEAIGKIGTDANEAVSLLVPALSETNTFVTGTAAEALGRFGPAARSGLPALLHLLDRLDGGPASRNRIEATFAVWKVDPSQEPRLISSLLQTMYDFRATELFAEMGSAAQAALPALRADLRAGAPNQQVNRALSIWKITGQTNGVLEVVMDAACNPTNTFPHYALLQWCRMQPESREPLEALIKLASSPNANVRQGCLQYFARLGPEARPALPIVKQWLADPNSSTRRAAGEAWLTIAPEEVAALLPK